MVSIFWNVLTVRASIAVICESWWIFY